MDSYLSSAKIDDDSRNAQLPQLYEMHFVFGFLSLSLIDDLISPLNRQVIQRTSRTVGVSTSMMLDEVSQRRARIKLT